jgi:hypothetical protein
MHVIIDVCSLSPENKFMPASGYIIQRRVVTVIYYYLCRLVGMGGFRKKVAVRAMPGNEEEIPHPHRANVVGDRLGRRGEGDSQILQLFLGTHRILLTTHRRRRDDAGGDGNVHS